MDEVYTRTKQQNRKANVKLVPMRAQSGAGGDSKDASFGQRRSGAGPGAAKSKGKRREADEGVEMSWVPSSTKSSGRRYL